MKAVERNYGWVVSHAWDIGARKRGLALHCFTVGEVVEALGFSRNTVKKYVEQMISAGLIKEVVMSKSIIIYKFKLSYIEKMEALNAAAPAGELVS